MALKAVSRGGTSITSGTFANKPSGASAGTQYFATDLGSGLMLVYTGSKWKPVGGIGVILFDGTPHTGAGTGVEANYFVFTVLAGLVSATGGLRITFLSKSTGTTAGKTLAIRHSASSGDVAGGTVMLNGSLGGSSTTLSSLGRKDLWNNGATNSQVVPNANVYGYFANASTAASLTGSIDMSVVSYLNFNANANAADTSGYQGIYIEWMEN